MASVNKAILVGNLGADPEIRYLPNGEAACSLRLATTEKWRDKPSGEPRETTEWHRVVMFRGLAEVARDHLKKGASVYIVGRLRMRRWQDKDGKERFTAEIEASEMKMLGGPRADVTFSPPEPVAKAVPVPVPGNGPRNILANWADDIPF